MGQVHHRKLAGFAALAFLAVALPASAATTYYSQGNLDPGLLSSWDSNRAGGGGAPGNFTSGDTFTIQTNNSMATTAAWAVGGAGCAIVIENGGMFTANNATTVTNFTVSDGGIYIHAVTSVGVNGSANDFPGYASRTCGPLSIVEIQKWANGGTSPVGLPAVNWGTLKINVASLGGAWNQTANLTSVAGNLVIQQTGTTVREFRLVANSPSTMTLNIAGDLLISGGTLVFSSGTAVPTVNVTGNVTMTGGILTQQGGSGLPIFNVTGAMSLSGGAQANIQSNFGTVPSSITVNGGTFRASGAVTLPAGTVFNVTGNSAVNSATTGNPLTLSNNITGTGNITQSTGALIFWGSNSFTGDLVIAATSGNNPSTRFNSDYSAGFGKVIVSPLASVATTLRNSGVPISTVTNEIVLNTGGSTIGFDTDPGNTFVLSGKISGAGTATRGANSGTGGMLALSGDNSAWSGGLNISRGGTRLGHKNALGTGPVLIKPVSGQPAVAVEASVPLTGVNAITNAITMAVIANNMMTFSGAADLELSGNILMTNLVTMVITNNNFGVTTLSGNISNTVSSVGIATEGAGTMVLAGFNTYNGPTTVRAGTLLANGPSSTGTNTVTVLSGARLGGTGTITGPVVVNAGGVVAAGNSAGTLAVGGLDLSAGGTNIWELAANSTSNPGTDFDRLAVGAGTLVLGGSSRLAIQFTGTATFPDATNAFWQSTRSWTIIPISGGASNPGSSNFSAIDGTNGVTAGTFSTSVSGGSIVLTFTPSGGAPPAPVMTTTIPNAGTTNAQVSWSSVNGSSYEVYASSTLTNWTLIGTVTASGATATYTDTNNPPAQVRFYRIRAL